MNKEFERITKERNKFGQSIQDGRINHAVRQALARNQTLIVGTSNHQERYQQLKALFPDAELEIIDLGIKIWKRK